MRHRLAYLRNFRIHENIFRGRFADGCDVSACNANCCKGGVWVDMVEHDVILSDADVIRTHMVPGQQKNPARWFNSEIMQHADFPSGRAVRTAVHNDACVFLDDAGRCVLHKASLDQRRNLKPFFCVIFPLTIEDGELMVDNKQFNPACCSLTSDGSLSVVDVCRNELQHVLGDDGTQELREAIAKRSGI